MAVNLSLSSVSPSTTSTSPAASTVFPSGVIVLSPRSNEVTSAPSGQRTSRTTKRTVTGPVEGFDQVYPMEKLDELLPQADVVALVVPHSPATVRLMDETRIGRMKDDAILISSGRGSVLDQDALVRAMGNGKLWGAALDVTDPEPLPEDSPLWDIPNLLLTPHVAGGIRLEITRRTCIQMAQENLRRYLAGEPLNNRVR